MFHDRTRQGRAFFAAGMAGRRDCQRGRGFGRIGRVPAALAVLVTVGLPATLLAQFPPPARPPKMGGQIPAPEQAKPATPANLPSAQDILDRHVKAIGGREAILSHSSLHARGSVSMPASGITGTLDIYGAKPNKVVSKVSLPGVGEFADGFDGTNGWSYNPITGPMLLEGKQLEEKRFDAEFHGELRAADRYASMTTLEQTEFEGRQCYKVRLVRKSGGEDIHFYDVQTGLKAGSMATRETQMGTMSGTTVEADYRKFGNLLHATAIRSNFAGQQQVITITSVEFDNVPDSVFDPPAAIKALLK